MLRYHYALISLWKKNAAAKDVKDLPSPDLLSKINVKFEALVDYAGLFHLHKNENGYKTALCQPEQSVIA